MLSLPNRTLNVSMMAVGQRSDTNFLNIILLVNHLILWIDQNPVELDPFGLITCGGVEFRRSTILPLISSQWINVYVDRSGFGEEDDSNTGGVGERELVLVFSVL